jgi:hypothetical protein
MTARIERDMPDVLYHQQPELSASQINTILSRGLKAYQHEREFPRKSTEAMELGTLFHSLVLGDPKLAQWDAERPRKGKDWEAFKAESEAKGLTVVRDKDYNLAASMAQAVRDHHIVGPLLKKPCERELSIFFHDPHINIPCRARLDLIPLDPNEPIIDLKSCDDIPETPWRTVADYGYHIQAEQYRMAALAAGFGNRRMLFVFVTKAAPRSVAVYELDSPWYALAASTRLAVAAELTLAQITGEWPERVPEIVTIPMPSFLAKESE